MKIRSSLSPSALSRYAPTIFFWWINKLSIKQNAKYIRNDSLLIVGAKVSKKSIPYTWENFWATNLVLNLAIKPLEWYLTLNTHFDPLAFCPRSSLSYSHVWWFLRFCNSSFMAFLHLRPWIVSLMASLYDVGLYILLLDLVIDIIVSVYSLFGVFSAIIGLSFFNNIVVSVKLSFWTFFLALVLLLLLFFSTRAFYLKAI